MNMIPHVFRLHPGQDLLYELQSYIQKKTITAASVLSCVGSLTEASLRLADQPSASRHSGPFEICSLVGTFSVDGPHLHISLSDSRGRMLGGHLLPGCLVYTTAEVVLIELSDMRFTRPIDLQTGYDELVITDQ